MLTLDKIFSLMIYILIIRIEKTDIFNKVYIFMHGIFINVVFINLKYTCINIMIIFLKINVHCILRWLHKIQIVDFLLQFIFILILKKKHEC